MVRITFAVAMIMVAFSSNPFLRRQVSGPSTNGASAQHVVKRENPTSQIVVPYNDATKGTYSRSVKAKMNDRHRSHSRFEALGM